MIFENIDFLQKVDRDNVSYDNIVTYTFVIKNRGFNTALDLKFKQVLNIIQEKMYITTTRNGIQFDAKMENHYVHLGDLEPNEDIEVMMNVVIEKPFRGEMLSKGFLNFLTIEKEKIEAISNEEAIRFKGADFNKDGEFKFYFNKDFAIADEEILIGIDIENKGNLEAEKVFIGDMIPDGCTYVNNSVEINEHNVGLDSEIESINIGKIALFQRLSVKYRVKLDRDFQRDKLKHRVSLKYENKIDEIGNQKIIKSNEDSLDVKLVKIENFKKIASKKEGTIGDIIHFEVSGENRSNLKLYDVILKDNISESLGVLKDSIIVNGVRAYNTNIKGGILLESLNIEDEFNLSYDAIINDSKVFVDSTSANLSFKFDCDGEGYTLSRSINTETCKVKIKAPNLKKSNKRASKKAAFLGDEITVTIGIRNSGNVRCNNILLVDTIPEYLEFIENSLFVDGEKAYSSEIGEINIEGIGENEEKEISYRAKVIDIPKYSAIKNKVKIIYTYDVDGKECTKESIFYGEDIVVNGAIIKKENIVKKVDRIYGILGDEITFNISFLNEGNFSCEKVFIKENEVRNLEFVQGSLTINGSETPYNIFKGFLYGEVEGNEKINISFRCIVKSIPFSSTIQSVTNIEYEYRGENGNRKIKKMVSAKSDEIIIKSAVINNSLGIFKKETPNSVGRVGDRIPIRIHLRNMGNTEAYNVVLTDSKIMGIEIIEDSFTIDGKKENYEDGIINIGSLKVNEEREILYFANVTKEALNTIESEACVSYCFYGNDGGTLIKSKGISSKLTLKVFNANLIMTESVNKESLEVGEVLNYNLYITNNGNINLKNLRLNLNIDSDEGILLDEITINRKIMQGISINTPISLDDIDKNESILVCAKISLNKLLMKNRLLIKSVVTSVYESDNLVLTKADFSSEGKEISVSLNRISIQKSTAKESYLVGEAVNYLITIRNDGTNPAENIIVYDDIIDEGFIQDSLTINGYPVVESFVSGIPVGNLKQGECIFIRYGAIYENNYNLNKVSSTVFVTCDFLDEKYGYMKKKFKGEEFKISLAKASLKIIKTSDKRVISYGDKINFITTIENDGTIKLRDLVFKESVSNGFNQISSNIFVNGSKVIKGDCLKGLTLPAVEPREILEVSTEYEYKNYKRIQRLQSESIIKYKYELSGNNDVYEGEEKSNKVFLESEIATFKNITIDHDIDLDEEDLWLGEIIDAIVTPKVTKSYVVKTIQNTSYSNENLTGYKLIIRGVLEEKIEYIANTEAESVHMIIHEERFSTSIILPEQYDINEDVKVDTIVHEVFSKIINEKKIQLSINLTVQGLI